MTEDMILLKSPKKQRHHSLSSEEVNECSILYFWLSFGSGFGIQPKASNEIMLVGVKTIVNK